MKDTKLSSRSLTLISAAAVIVLILTTVLSAVLFQRLIDKSLTETDTFEPKYYKYHFALISPDYDDPFWISVWNAANVSAGEVDAYVEWVGRELSEEFSAPELMRAAIEESVDGILVRPDGSPEMAELINEAVERGIPVITLISDALGSERQGFMGYNSYDLGLIYGEQVLKIITENDRSHSLDAFNEDAASREDDRSLKVTVLFDSEAAANDQNIIFSGIVETVDGYGGPTETSVDIVTIDNQNAFSAEEAIRELIVSPEGAPDVLICLNSTNTLCAFQAVVDYNMVGSVSILGYYDSEDILNAVKKRIIQATVSVDSKEIGRGACVALYECVVSGRTNDYAVGSLNVITSENVDRYLSEMKKGEAEEQ